MTYLIITRGISGSGKTTWAKKQERYVRVNRDDIRRELYPERGQDYYAVSDLRKREDNVTKVSHARISALLGVGMNVVCDDTNLPVRTGRELMRLAEDAGASVRVVSFEDVPVEVCIARQNDRPEEERVPEEAIRRMYSRFIAGGLSPLPATSGLSEKTADYSGLRRVSAVQEGTPAYIFDIDGTLAHMNGRGPHDYHRVGEDLLDTAVATMIDNLAGAYPIIILSGRKGSCRKETEKWLADRSVPYDLLLMRDADDNRVDWQVKYDLFDRYVRGVYSILGVFDDRDQVVRMWRHIGLKCFQVQEGAF